MRIEKVQSVQTLRLVAASMVLVGHAQHEAESLFRGAFISWNPLLWWGGVDLFFVISGFIMMHVAGDDFGRPGAAAAFFVRRLQRIVPLYWLFTSLMLAAAFLLPSAVDHPSNHWDYIAASYLFVPWARADGAAEPVLALGWTLNYEMFFYVLFAAALCLSRIRGLWSLAILMIGLSLLHPWIPRPWTQIRAWSDPVILEFLAGIGLALARRAGVRLPRPMAIFLILAAVPLIFLTQKFGLRFFAYGLPALVASAGVVLCDWPPNPGRLSKALHLGGDASYAIYLSHPFTLNIVRIVWGKAHLPHPWAFIALATVASIVVGVIVHRALEAPLLRLLARRRPRPAATATI
jgi:exopolysaccharide production protein ExoZ